MSEIDDYEAQIYREQQKPALKLKPLGDRILIKPEAAPEQTESGLWLREDRKPELTGTVVAVGFCSHPLKAEAEEVIAEFEERLGNGYEASEDWIKKLPDYRAVQLLRQATAREPQVKEGDYVVFSWTAGQELTLEDERYLLMHESDILAVVEGIDA